MIMLIESMNVTNVKVVIVKNVLRTICNHYRVNTAFKNNTITKSINQ